MTERAGEHESERERETAGPYGTRTAVPDYAAVFFLFDNYCHGFRAAHRDPHQDPNFVLDSLSGEVFFCVSAFIPARQGRKMGTGRSREKLNRGVWFCVER